jgi:hypothetical protein
MRRPITDVLLAAKQLALRAVTLFVVGLVAVVPWSPPLALSTAITSMPQPSNYGAAGIPNASTQQVQAVYAKLPLSFEPNRGQTDARVKFLARGSGYVLFLTSREAVLTFAPPQQVSTRSPLLANPAQSVDSNAVRAVRTVVRMRLAGANVEPAVTGWDRLPGTVSYFIGNDPAQWRTTIPTYSKVIYKDVYPGIDLAFSGSQGQLEYDFIVHPGGNPSRIAVEFQGADRLEVSSQGDLILHTATGPIHQRKPVIYQEFSGIRQEIAGGYVLTDKQLVTFRVASYDVSQPLIIDPVLFYSTYLGGSGDDFGYGIAVDAVGNAYVTGTTTSTNFPTTAGAFQTASGGRADAFVTKLNPTGSAPLVYSTYLGGSGDDGGRGGIAVDALGNAYVTGFTNSTNFPTTVGAFQTTYGGGFGDAFVTKLNPTGAALVYSTYLGGSDDDEGLGIAVDALGNAYVTGVTFSTNFPTTAGAFQTASGGSVDAFVTKLNPTGSAPLVYSTYLGGSGLDEGLGIAVDALGNAYVTGDTTSTNFPTTVGAFQTTYGGGFRDAFVTKLNPTGSAPLVYSTYLGGSGGDIGWGVAVDAAGNAYVTGNTTSTNFPTTAGAFQTASGGSVDAFVTKLNPTGSAPLVYSTYLGGSGDDGGRRIAVDALGNAYVTGFTTSTNFPTTVGAFQTTYGGGIRDAFVAKIADVQAEQCPPSGQGECEQAEGEGEVNDNEGGTETFSFIVRRPSTTQRISGGLQYVNRTTGAKVQSVSFLSLGIAGNTAMFAGTCTKNGVPCLFTVNVAASLGPGSPASFTISISGSPTKGGTLRGGSILITR